MRRLLIRPRSNWQAQVEQLGLVFHTPEGRPYWDESACYRFSSREVDALEAATEELQQLCLKAGQFIIDNDRFDDFRIPKAARPAIREAWEQEPPSIYGRFDLMYDGSGPPKLLEYNANTPTSLLEASVVQWHWHLDSKPGTDQFNSIHEKLIAQWRDIRTWMKSNGHGTQLHFASMDDAEDTTTVTYLRDTAEQGGISTSAMLIREIGWNEPAREFRDLDERRIDNIFALYPWEWLLKDFPGPLIETAPNMVWIEPIWKMMWSNKALLAVLWEMFPGHPNLLEAHLDGPRGMSEFVKKPLLSREGANITIHTPGGESSTAGPYGIAEGMESYVYQALAPAACFDGMRPVLGSWYVTDHGAAGIGIRESDGPVTGNLSRFVPHFFD
jgi:glutathionylspermidine synthase